LVIGGDLERKRFAVLDFIVFMRLFHAWLH